MPRRSLATEDVQILQVVAEGPGLLVNPRRADGVPRRAGVRRLCREGHAGEQRAWYGNRGREHKGAGRCGSLTCCAGSQGYNMRATGSHRDSMPACLVKTRGWGAQEDRAYLVIRSS